MFRYQMDSSSKSAMCQPIRRSHVQTEGNASVSIGAKLLVPDSVPLVLLVPILVPLIVLARVPVWVQSRLSFQSRIFGTSGPV